MIRIDFLLALALLFCAGSARAGYNGIAFSSGFPKEVTGQCRIQGTGGYYLDDACVPPVEIVLYAEDTSGESVNQSCGSYGMLKGIWNADVGSGDPCVLVVPQSGTYQVYAEMSDHQGYRFRTQSQAVSVSCP